MKLANPCFIKQFPGRKSDVKDAQWIAECLQKSFNCVEGTAKIMTVTYEN
jgi:hypothetical protein